jgi:predicted PurR-regulated permease PerM
MQGSQEGSGVTRGGFLLFLASITLALAYVAWPFASALLWSVLAAIMFRPLYLSILGSLGGRQGPAAIVTLLAITLLVVVPAVLIGGLVVDQATQAYVDLRDQEIDVSLYFERLHDGLPARLREVIDSSGYGDFEKLQSKVTEFLNESAGLIARYAVTFGGNAFTFVLSFVVGIYVTYFFLRDGSRLGPAISQALPFEADIAERLTDTFVTVVRATIKGSVVVGLVQGGLGAITFLIVGIPSAALFGVLMAILSLVPALGPAIIWLPAAIYLLLTGDIWQGVVVIASGIVVIGMADNVLRPILVGRDTGLPDWVVLITTLGGIATFGLSGIVIGPLVAGLFLAGWTILREERSSNAADLPVAAET